MAALRERVEQTSIRAVADELGMSPSGLHVLLHGSKPRAGTRRKLLEWYAEIRSRSAGRRAGVPAEDVDAAVAVLDRYLNADSRETVHRRRVREIAARLFDETEPAG
jgi:hypothetical protein